MKHSMTVIACSWTLAAASTMLACSAVSTAPVEPAGNPAASGAPPAQPPADPRAVLPVPSSDVCTLDLITKVKYATKDESTIAPELFIGIPGFIKAGLKLNFVSNDAIDILVEKASDPIERRGAQLWNFILCIENRDKDYAQTAEFKSLPAAERQAIQSASIQVIRDFRIKTTSAILAQMTLALNTPTAPTTSKPDSGADVVPKGGPKAALGKKDSASKIDAATLPPSAPPLEKKEPRRAKKEDLAALKNLLGDGAAGGQDDAFKKAASELSRLEKNAQ